MKNRFSTLDIVAIINELQKLIGMRVNQVYDVDNKTYLIRLNRYEEKVVLLLESGVRIHTTDFEWPKNPSPSGFSMKMRKHLKNKRLEKLTQLGIDRIVDLQFGINDAAYHVILELYDRGNIVFTDYEYTILNILRPRTTDSEDVKFIVREHYPIDKATMSTETFNRDELYSALNKAKDGDSLKKLILPQVAFGPALLDHVLLKNNFPKNCGINKEFKVPADIHRLFLCLEEADALFKEIAKSSEGYVIQKKELNKDWQEIITNIEFHPYLFHQFSEMSFAHYESFDKAVDNYFSNMEGQKIDLKALQKEKEALKKLANVKKDHEKRLMKLQESQTEDFKKAQLIELNSDLVERAITILRSAIANQISWNDINVLIKEGQADGDPVAKAIKKLKLNINHFTLFLSPPFTESDEEEDLKPQLVDIDLDCSAYANARKYYDMKRAHAKKEQKTLESSEKAFKSAEKKTKQTLKEVAVTTSITKARKVMWFEKFLWFISSENYLVIGGRDVQQNELLVKRYLKASDIYVHADLHGASSVVIKNPLGKEVPPKTLNDAGTMAACYSSGWDAKIVTSAWWVYSHQVSKTAPSGEYLTTGSFMIRGRKNYLTPANLIMGFGFMFKLDDESIANHSNERTERNEEIKQEVEEETKQSESFTDLNNQAKSEEVDESEDSESNTSSSDVGEEPVHAPEVPEEKIDDEMNDNDVPHAEVTFPDTEIKFDVLSEGQALSQKDDKIKMNAQGIIVQEHKKKAFKVQNVESKNQSITAKEKPNQLKRGQKGKLKKIKEKYKYQDEEERQLRMSILASAGTLKEDKKNKNKKSKGTNMKQNNSQLKQTKSGKKSVHFFEISEESSILENKSVSDEIKHSLPSVTEPVAQISEPEKEQNDVEDKQNDASDEEDEIQSSDELKLLNSLTGCPLPEDTLLFSIPVCAPYPCVLNYKYKVKIIPGSSRRGKAAKTAVQVFLHDKAATQREKDLLKCVKDQDISRNLPGKIKISAGNLKKGK